MSNRVFLITLRRTTQVVVTTRTLESAMEMARSYVDDGTYEAGEHQGVTPFSEIEEIIEYRDITPAEEA